MSEHTWFQDNLSAYSAGGLSAEERERFERHADRCSDCARALADWRGLDEALETLFTEVRPAAGWEDRLIRNLRAAPARSRLRWPLFVRAAACVAAVVLLGVLGSFLYGLVLKDSLPFPGMVAAGKTQASNHLTQLALDLSDSLEDRETNGKRVDPGLAGRSLSRFNFKVEQKLEERLSKESLGESLEAVPHSLGVIVKAPSRVHTDLAGGLIGGKKERTPPVDHFGVLADGSEPRKRLEALKLKSDIIGGRAQDGEALDDNKTLYFREERKLAEKLKGVAPLTDGPAQPAAPEGKAAGTMKADIAYFIPTDLARLDTFAREGAELAAGDKNQAGLGAKNQAQAGEKAVAAGQKKEPEPVLAGLTPRKIIRTGDIEFEVESFDGAVADVSRLVNAIKGGFVATVNSDKLQNGKVKGSVVVRMPPENLDKFLLDLRRELAKAGGELKSQRIGSQDVSKQYTDVESRLKAARTMEERLLNIIKTGKGEIKDLVAAENALGVWRTKIEEMEGEIRYYNNQVSLSTLTIALQEKELRASFALVATERIGMRIEVEDVEKAQREALQAAGEAKGRVTKSELKQPAPGQYEAILIFEVAPAAAPALLEQLKKLGTVTDQDSTRLVQAEGGKGPVGEIKTKQKDAQFQVVLYNVAAIPPREVYNLQLATRDVPGSFRKLQDAVAKARGRVTVGQLNEQDKVNITATFDFDILSQEKVAIDKLFTEVGQVLSRSTSQAPPGKNVTDRKVGYRLVLRSVANIPPREKVSLGIVVKDVERAAADLTDLVRSSKGLVAASQVNQEPNGRVTALLLFDVPLSVKDELVRKFKESGSVRLQQTARNPQVPDNELASAHIDVTLTSTGPIVPSDEGLWPQIRTGLFYSFKLLSWSLMFVILGVSVVLPWALLVWGGYKLVGKLRKKTQPAG